jgi:hypothetical protein
LGCRIEVTTIDLAVVQFREGQYQRGQRLEIGDNDLGAESALVAGDFRRGTSVEDWRDMQGAGAGPLDRRLKPLQQLRDRGRPLGQLRSGSLC